MVLYLMAVQEELDMKQSKNSFSYLHWKYAKEIIKKPFLFINRHINRYSLTQDEKKKK